MPNHFHLLVKQEHSSGLDAFMKSLCTRYAMYKNISKKRVGGLFQGVYKAVLVESEEQLLWVSRYIHRNPLSLGYESSELLAYQFSSLPGYLSVQTVPFVKQLEFFENARHISARTYREFVLGKDTEDGVIITYPLMIDSEG
jgi:hypothetical protein